MWGEGSSAVVLPSAFYGPVATVMELRKKNSLLLVLDLPMHNALTIFHLFTVKR